jgi:hypothetical protein
LLLRMYRPTRLLPVVQRYPKAHGFPAPKWKSMRSASSFNTESPFRRQPLGLKAPRPQCSMTASVLNVSRIISRTYNIAAISSQLGAMAEVAEDRRTGVQFQPGNAQYPTRAIDSAQAGMLHLALIHLDVRREFELKCSPARSYIVALVAYEWAITNPCC